MQKIPAVVGSWSTETYNTLHSVRNLKATQMNEQCNLIQELMVYKFKLGLNTVKATKNSCCVKGQGAVDHGTVTKWFKKFYY